MTGVHLLAGKYTVSTFS